MLLRELQYEAEKSKSHAIAPGDRRQIANTLKGLRTLNKFEVYNILGDLNDYKLGRPAVILSDNWQTGNSSTAYIEPLLRLDPEHQQAADYKSINSEPVATARVLWISERARKGVREPYCNDIDGRRRCLELYLNAEHILGKIWGYDRVAAGVYRPRGPIRKLLVDFVRRNPDDVQFAIDLVQRHTWNPTQLNLDFGQ